MDFEKVKSNLIASFPGCNIRFDRENYIEISIDANVLSNLEVKREFFGFLTRYSNFPVIKVDQISPSEENDNYYLGASFVCDDENYSLCVATCLWIKKKTIKEQSIPPMRKKS